jgi:hypothetical protein
MDISINEQPADIILESEKTVGELLAGIEAWLHGSDNRISGLRIDGQQINAFSLTEVFQWDLAYINSIDITVSTWRDLAFEALYNTQEDLKCYENASFEERRHIKNAWDASVTARFLADQIPDIFVLADKTLSGEGFSTVDMGRLVDERIRELADPLSELKHIHPLISEIVLRLEDLPVDIQTGKDGKVAETVQLFSHIMDKLFRIIRLLKLLGYALETLIIDALPLTDYINDFKTMLKDLLGAYEVQDAVLVGDLAEYELAPRLLKLYSSLNDLKADDLIT